MSHLEDPYCKFPSSLVPGEEEFFGFSHILARIEQCLSLVKVTVSFLDYLLP